MKVVIYHAKTFKDCSAALMQALSQRPPAPEESNILLVPDKLTLAAESEVLYAAKSRGTFNTFVHSFTKFCSVLGQGREKGSYLDKQGSIQLLARLIDQSKNELKWFSNAAQREGFAEIVYNTISKLRYCLISPEQMKSYGGGGQLQAKSADIALLYEKYCGYIKDRFFDSCTKLDILYELLDRPDCLKNTHIYLKDFDNFSRQEMRVIKKMMAGAESLSVACTMGKTHLYKNQIFEGILSACNQMGVQPVLIDCDNNTDPLIEHIKGNLFSLGGIKKIPSEGRVKLYSASHAFSEAESAARYISEGVRKGARYKDFTIVCGIADYRLPLQRAFAQYNIPCFLDEGTNLAAHPLGRFLRSVVEAKTEGMTASRAVAIAKSPFGIPSCADELENFCLRHNIKSFKKPFSDKNAEKARIVAEGLVKGLDMPKMGSVETFVAAIRGFLTNMEADQALAALAVEESEAGIEIRSRVTVQVKDALEEVLKGAERSLAGFFVEDKTFVKILFSGMEAVDISVVPMHLDAVYIGEITTSKYHAVKNLIVLGCVEGVLPGESKDTGLFSERNIADLKAEGIDIEPSVVSENAREKFNVYQLMCEPHRIFLSYPRANCRGQKNKESHLFSDFVKMFDCTEEAPSFEEQIFTREQAEILLCNEAGKTFQYEEEYKNLSSLYYAIDRPLFEKTDPEVSVDVSGLFSKFSCSKIETFYDCPYKHFLTYGIKLRPRDLPDLLPFDMGSILHAVAEEYLKSDRQKNAEQILDAVLEGEEYKKIQASSNFAVLRKRLSQEAEMLCRSIEEGLQNSDFVPDKDLIEYNFDHGDMTGKIDRVDTAGEFVRVIDYKTGKVDTGLKDVYTGRRLQLFIYLAAAVKKTGLKPAGAYYFPVSNDFEYATKDKPSRLVGFSLDNAEAVRASDKNNCGEIPAKIQIDKNGSLCVKSVWNDKTLTEEQMDILLKYAQRMVENAKQKIVQGNIAPSPYDGACGRCDFGVICNQTKKQVRKVPAPSKKNFREV